MKFSDAETSGFTNRTFMFYIKITHSLSRVFIGLLD